MAKPWPARINPRAPKAVEPKITNARRFQLMPRSYVAIPRAAQGEVRYLCPMSDGTLTLGIDLGGTHARAALVDAHARILESDRVVLADRGFHAVVETLAAISKKLIARAPGRVELCGVGVAGQVRGKTGQIAVAPNLGWREAPLGSELAAKLGLPVRVVNDLSAAAWGEFKAGAARGHTEVLTVFVGSGVGSALVCGGRLVLGADGVAGELGHIKVELDGRPCGCGERGCLEAYSGGHSLIAQMREAIDSGAPTALSQANLPLSPRLLEDAALQGDPLAKQIYERALGYLSLTLANQVTMLNPSCLVLGGGVLTNCPGMLARLESAVRRYAAKVSAERIQVLQAALGDDSGLLGASLLARANE